MKTIGLLAAGVAAVGFAHSVLAQDAGSDDDLIEIGGDRSAISEQPAPAEAQTVAVPEPLPISLTPQSDPVGLARLRAPFDLIADDEALEKRLSKQGIVHRLRGIDVPFLLQPPGDVQPDGRIWHKGKMPKKTLLARLSTRPLSEVEITFTDKDEQQIVMRLAEAAWRSTNDPKPAYAQTGIIYCSRSTEKTEDDDENPGLGSFCLVDEDRNGTFDAYMAGEGERNGTVHALNFVGPPLPLATPAQYRTVDDFQLGQTAEWHTCGKDWDKPYFVPHLVEGQIEGDAPSEISARRWGVYCDRGEPTEAFLPVEKKAITADLGSLIFEIGSKKRGAKATVRGLLNQDVKYREESGKIVPTSVGMTPMHARISTAQHFDIKPFLFDGRENRAEGVFGKDEVFLTLGFRHGYTGVVESDVVIRTLLSKRTVEGGEYVYGVPAEKRSVVYGGYGGTTILGPPVKRTMNTALVWCLPTREEKPIYDRRSRKPTGKVDIEWTATCLPETSAGNHTVLKDQSPALAVNNMRMEASISTNDGPPPVTQTQNADFGAPLSFRYKVDSVSKNLITLKEEVLLGEEVTSTSDVLLAIVGEDSAPVTAAGGQLLLKIVEDKDGDNPKFELQELRPLEEGESARVVGVDILAMLRALLANGR
ncbi:hypothetical protein [Pontixanthobacter sp. CEM42]|uniref:hypothetical protein n=1 Tax=Pontixanthobacter sp. CEM42 TaxID=2792077 RepID=UPI001ADF1D74|nr:hypothetical protein [Pontixanthobacter sp. CEM42]